MHGGTSHVSDEKVPDITISDDEASEKELAIRDAVDTLVDGG
jgi:hypothetical protein